MTITYSQHYAKFTFTSLLTKTPIVFSLRIRSKETIESARARFEEEFIRLEREVESEELGARAIPHELKKRARSVFKRILRGDYRIVVTEVSTWKMAKNLNERGENNYVTTHEERVSHTEWR